MYNRSLYLGSRFHAKEKDLLRNLGVTHILNVTDDVENAHEGKFNK